MATGMKKGLNPARQVGSGVTNQGLSTYSIASGYSTGLGLGDPVKLASDGTIVRATNDSADAIGVFKGVKYVDSSGNRIYSKQWPASTVATEIEALVMDSPSATFNVLGEGPIPLVQKGDIFAMNLTSPDTKTGLSTMTAKTTTEVVGDVNINGSTDLPTDVTGIAANDAFTIRTSQASSATTITFVASYDTTTLLSDLNNVANISASLNSSGYLTIRATDGYDLVITESVNTPFAALFPYSAGTFSATVASNAGLVKVVNVTDVADKVMEVVLVDHALRDDG